MNLKYKILWFEDDEDVIDEEVGSEIREFLVELGFEPIITHRLNGDKLKELLNDKNYDLIVTDLNLGEHETGKELIDEIRKGRLLTEVLLYSASPTDLQRVIEREGWVERASYCAGLGNLRGRLKEIILLTVRKHQDVNNTRGLVIAETIILEKKIENILLHYFAAEEERILNEKKTAILKAIHERKIKKHEDDIAEIGKVSITDIKSLIEKDILTASNSFDALHGILKERIAEINAKLTTKGIEAELKARLEEKRDELKTVKIELNNFREEILKLRNTLAHVIEEFGEDGIPFLKSLNADGTFIKFDHDKYIEIRRNLIKHNDNLEKILKHLQEI